MKIFFVISNKSHGKGGHFYSLRSTALELKKYFDVEILNIGVCSSPVISSKILTVHFVKYSNIFTALAKSFCIVREKQPDVIHAFDSESLFFCRILSFVLDIPLVFTKCGGKNPGRFFPRVTSMILYSQENYDYFLSDGRFAKPHNIYLIPNRISTVCQDKSRIEEIKRKLRKNAVLFFRISRISSYYLKSLEQSITLINRLVQDGFNVQLLIVGAIQDQAAYQEIKRRANKNIIIETEERFTIDAAELNDISDYVIGTGRGFMEAAMIGKVMLVPVANHNIPVLVSENNIDNVSSTNFSERTLIVRAEDECYAEIINVLNDRSAYNKLSRQIQKYAKEKFMVDGVSSRYIKVYQAAQKVTFRSLGVINILLHGYLTRKNFRHSDRIRRLQKSV